ncbi:hypothetical protein BAUCODRAFT_34222 [Baudoinia panamericana UAMH 10762]|uniref:Vps52-domain-containing protein n=1 Tax=Baudoinia panamericana (strain UAMH 10762) TaxID=717646 RepID=M2ND24_BAUPA|nr:uncharacterized protein BAUCODRAFT_34222 [Baudoinia panamericana UAMH 10762]EMC96825.1 hypothetical protein BAUCODRAFT_34222 [Baudoinia panamericana UAMH 10762]
MWLDRFSGQPNQSPATAASLNRTSSPAPRRAVQLGPSTLPRRPGLNPRSSSLSIASFGGSLESLPAAARLSNGSSLKQELTNPPNIDVVDPLDVLHGILGAVDSDAAQTDSAALDDDPIRPRVLTEDVDFGGRSLQEFANSTLARTNAESYPPAAESPLVEDFERQRDKFEELHKSILACDEVLKSVETYLTSFQADLAAVSSEIEHLQDRSTQLNNKLNNRKAVEKVLAPEVEAFAVSPVIVRKITEGTVDEAWVKALEEFEKRSKLLEAKVKEGRDIKAVQDIRPFINDVSTKAVERIRDYVVAQIKALRSPNINAQVIQQMLRYRNVFGFLSSRQPQLAEEMAQAYINTMRWYYTTHFSRYKTALDKLNIYAIDQTCTIAADPAAKRAAKAEMSFDPFSIGRRGDLLRATTHEGALPSFAAEDDKSIRPLEIPFRAFNLALIDNATAEYGFLTEFFTQHSFQTTNRKFTDVFAPTFQMGQELTKRLIESTLDGLGVLLCVRLTQHFAFELQRRKVPAMEGYVNATNMLLWPRFQQIIDAHCDSIRKLTASLPGKPAGSALNLTSSPSSAQTTAPHPLTQRFANLVHGILCLSSEAGDDEPVSHSLRRLGAEFEVFLVKMSKGIAAEARKRERFLYNNYSLVCTIVAETEGKLAEEVRGHFEGLRDG